MITIKLGGGLGNNMFQYAAARTLAEHKGYDFCHFPIRGRRFYKKRAKEYLLRLCGSKPEATSKQNAQADISLYFTLGGYKFFRTLLFRLFWFLTPKARKSEFVQSSRALNDIYSFPIFDPDFFAIEDWCELRGSFQSNGYFEDNRASILEWFTLKPNYRKILIELDRKFPSPPQERCCIHVRRGDYLIMDKGLAWQDQGWALPLSYYKEAVSRLPDNLLYIIVTDNPAYVRDHFDFIENKIVMSDNPEAVDMHLFTRCRYNIIANSTFSWWGAWLNEQRGKQVIGPKYHLGWARKTWLPWVFECHPKDWAYIDVLDTITPADRSH